MVLAPDDLGISNGLPQGSTEDRQLTLAFQRGEKGAYQAIYDRYHARVNGVCRRMLNNQQDAQEAAQETYLRVYQGLGRFNGRYQLGPWISRIATNVCLDQLRAKSRRPFDSVPGEFLDVSPGEDDADPETLVVRNSEGRRVRKMLNMLPPLHRAAIILRDFEGLSYSEVAETLELSETQVKALLHRARQNFKRSWARAGLAALLPTSLFERLIVRSRSAGEAVSSGVAQVAVSSAPGASACGAFFHQCGQVVFEKVTPFAAAAIIGVGAVAVAPQDPPRLDRSAASSDAAATSTDGARHKTAKRSAGSREEDPRPATPDNQLLPAPGVSPSAQPPSDPDEEPAEEPNPEPSPQPTTPADDDTNGKPAPVADLQVAIGFDHGEAIPTSPANSATLDLDCDAQRFKQSFYTSIHDGDKSYPGMVEMEGFSSTSFYLTLSNNGNEVRYTGAGPRISSSSNGDILTLEFAGSFGTGGPAGAAGVPSSGRFRTILTLDCASASVISESIALTT